VVELRGREVELPVPPHHAGPPVLGLRGQFEASRGPGGDGMRGESESGPGCGVSRG